MAIKITSTGAAEAVKDQATTTQQTNAATTTQQQTTVPEATKTTTTTTPTTTTTTTDQTTQVTNPGNGVSYQQFQPTYSSQYDDALADLYNQITNRQPFTYNAGDDAMYQQYMDRYITGGQRAMEDTMAQAAALTGGYGSSYGQQVGQQTYDEYLTGLNDMALELEQAAYQRYQDQGDQLAQQYSMLGALDERDYGRWADQYDRGMAEAALRASAGDFDAYKQMWGDDVGGRMQALYAAQTLMPLYTAGQISAEDYKEIAGEYPVGYVEPGQGGGGSSGDSGSWYLNRYNLALSKGLTSKAVAGRSEATSNTFYNLFNTV